MIVYQCDGCKKQHLVSKIVIENLESRPWEAGILLPGGRRYDFCSDECFKHWIVHTYLDNLK